MFAPTQEFYHGNLPNRIGYPEELSGHLTTGLHLTKGPSLIDNPDIKVTLDRQPRLGPPGTVLLNIRVQTTIGGNDLFFCLGPPIRGCVCLEIEIAKSTRGSRKVIERRFR